MDEADSAQFQIEELLSRQIAQARAARSTAPADSDSCLYCAAAIGRRFCDAECRADYDRESMLIRRRGG